MIIKKISKFTMFVSHNRQTPQNSLTCSIIYQLLLLGKLFAPCYSRRKLFPYLAF